MDNNDFFNRGRNAGSRISRATLTAQLEEALRVDILEGVLRPGQRIRANEMTERYGVSATPLREALQRLAVENLVELDPRLGATVAPISEADLRDIYEMLQLLDGLALQRSIERGDDAWIAEVEQRFGALSEAIARHESVTAETDDDTRRRAGIEWALTHWEFHQALYRACGSPWLLRFVRTLHAHSERYRMLAWHRREGAKRDSRAEHLHIMEAAKARDAEAAVSALHQHLGTTVDLLLRSLKDQGPMAGVGEART
jgi:DNA-binding GntR family transcriptional regulator